MSVDPELRKQQEFSPYKGLGNNPNILIDPNGKIEYQINLIIDKNTGVTIMQIKTAKRIMTDGDDIRKNGFTGGATWSFQNYYYDYATITTTTIGKDGKSKTSSEQILLIENGVKSKESVWFGGDDPGETKKEKWLFDESKDFG